MLKTLAQTVCVSIVTIVVAFQSVEARDIPIVKKITLLIPLKEFSTIEFPFEIKGHDFTPFVSTLNPDDDKQALSLPSLPPLNNKEQEISLPTLDDKKKNSSSTVRRSAKLGSRKCDLSVAF